MFRKEPARSAEPASTVKEGATAIGLGLSGPLPAERPVEPAAPPTAAGVSFQTLLNQLQIADASGLIAAIERKRGSRVLCLNYNDLPPTPMGLAPAVLPTIEAALAEIGHVPKLDLLLRSSGGLIEVSWRLVSLLREFTDELGIMVSRIGLSAGCLVALAADDLVMGPLAVLSSVDPTRQHPLLPKDPQTSKLIPGSVQDLEACVQFVREQLGGECPPRETALVIAELFKHVHPLALGAMEQAHNLARLLTRKVLHSRNRKLPEEQVERVVDMLTGKYCSHSLQISRAEVEADLGLPVTRPDAELSALVAEYEKYYQAEFRKSLPAASNPKEHLIRPGGFVQTTDSGWAITLVYKADGVPVADPWLRFRGRG